jgi:hypothetical protein
VIRFTQDDEPYYGNSVWAFEIKKLNPKEYQEERIGRQPILRGFDHWNTRGMHHISPCLINNKKWIFAVDGY